MARPGDAPPTLLDLEKAYQTYICETMPLGLVPAGQELHWLDQLLFGSAAALEYVYRVQSDLEKFLTGAPEGLFVIGFWGHGIQSHAFYVQRVEPWCRVYLRLPYGGAYSDREADARNLHSTLLALPAFLADARRVCRHLRLVDSMGLRDVRAKAHDGSVVEGAWSVLDLARDGLTLNELRD